MGTNYYMRYRICECCERYDEIHIGKSSYGWTFSFHAFREGDYESLATVGIKSYKEWIDLLENIKGGIYDEYGQEISLDEFKNLVKSKEKEKFNHTTYCQNSENSWDRRHAEVNCFLDEEGHSFSYGDFL